MSGTNKDTDLPLDSVLPARTYLMIGARFFGRARLNRFPTGAMLQPTPSKTRARARRTSCRAPQAYHVFGLAFEYRPTSTRPRHWCSTTSSTRSTRPSCRTIRRQPVREPEGQAGAVTAKRTSFIAMNRFRVTRGRISSKRSGAASVAHREQPGFVVFDLLRGPRDDLRCSPRWSGGPGGL